MRLLRSGSTVVRQEKDLARAREAMVATQIAGRGVRDPRVIAAMRKVPREEFVPEPHRAHAYDDSALPIGCGQTISQPYIVALMIEALGLEGGEHVLEVGSGSGYAAAVLAEIAADVIGIERQPELARRAQETLTRLGYDRVTIIEGDGSLGYAPAAPYDAILVSAAAPEVPPALIEQLRPGGRLVLPVGRLRAHQVVRRIEKDGRGRLREEDITGVRFVPLVGKAGWKA
ncbi:MAG: protein-L-isoaspartate(D-aspartate) O-methyltransferase [Alphaproteobacteria bacterium]|nr:MAG: protein-L-isoaspartate(D-aspartate) O-methyltransferase [Alphaproteobacteria bacterium]